MLNVKFVPMRHSQASMGLLPLNEAEHLLFSPQGFGVQGSAACPDTRLRERHTHNEGTNSLDNI